MIDCYINKRRQIMKKNQEKDNYIFGLFFGFILLLLNISIFLSTPDIKVLNYVNIIFMILGCMFILVATIYPNALGLVHKLLNKLFNIIGNLIFKIFLTILYFILVLPIGLIIKSKEKKEIRKKSTNFINYKSNNNLEGNKKGFYNIFLIFKLFNNERYALMLPLIIVLIAIGFLLIFVQSSVIAPFIYTLF
ncbi:MAG: hypothetical protein HFI86_03790 [Bacilli bacterium]|nr:hypothetical protein [Bacilli bacterium]MCI9434386.1 hypothetical protein [Bacilli bacterium]